MIEVVQPEPVESVFLPVCPPPESLLWFKRQGIKMYVNDPRPSFFVLLKALLENDDERFSEESLAKCNRVINRSPNFEINPFRSWEDHPFSRKHLDYLFFWREAVEELSLPMQKYLFFAAVRNVLFYWLSIANSRQTETYAPDEVLGYFLKQTDKNIFKGREKLFVINEPISNLGDEVDCEMYIVPLLIKDFPKGELDPEIFFQAWIKGFGKLSEVFEETQKQLGGWIFDWGSHPNFEEMVKKSGKATFAVISWTSQYLPPKILEEQIVTPLLAAFTSKFPKYVLHIKTADRVSDDHDYMMVFSR